jgi:cation transport ATPase
MSLQTLTFPTTLHCDACVKAIKPFFDSAPNIKSWQVDLSKPVKTITVSGTNITRHEIAGLLRKADYDIVSEDKLKSSALPEIHSTSKEPGFWKDKMKWRRASLNTLTCLAGCSIGDFSAVVVLQGFFSPISVVTQMAVAVVAGLCTSMMLESVILRVRENFTWKQAVSTAMSMSLLSMITMETAMNTSDFLITGGKRAFTKPQYWIAFAIAAVVGFLIPLPYNYYKLKKYDKACH